MDSTKYLSVQSLTKYIKYKFEKDPYLQRVFLKGELSNVKHHSNGHIYFSIKDDKSVISAVMFRYDAEKLNFKPEEGQNVLLAGNITLYEARGQYQIYVKEMQIDGIGQLFLKLEQNKELLKKKGYLNPEHKKPIPAFPEHIAIVSSSTSAAIKDMITTLTRRYPLVKVTLLNTYVQGGRSQESVLTNLSRADRLGVDTVILARGGGSIEDLWTFNELEVALQVFNMNTPVITGVGHETDSTLVDYVSDLRAPTPTAAAEQAVPNIRDLNLRLGELHRQFDSLIMSKIDRSKKHLESLADYYKFKNPNLLYTEQTEKLRDLTMTLDNYMSSSLLQHRHLLDRNTAALSYNNPAPRIRDSKQEQKRMEDELKRRMKTVLDRKTERLAGNINVLESVSPVQILKRGYSYTTFNNKIVTEAKNLKVGDVIETSFNQGTVSAKVTEVNTDD
ncbi:exodeoxyribonuclease 7 large subunit [Jeotgalicoccus coquinae]|uniref:Exodeoxyribonuclease 7 large subunit n=1 Tax=Jeotgalicoccus coquinae TaxID=709509 RepID=A0A6V7RA07_9STAP|nr:exodeoxyribonuclease VII large subunit [Jeotgalicoccus coquinae]MBB6422895.1 exodeoxyribonuclease VII large subunit [Jeotgalicoccus coquinae]GGE12289.1 exodeoxyribonuclease 7 large subunit [Jeotgalicoccus coquinae]CAD2073725.1 Exodeoxyribonuclease 7 large subunit [Jeotgalicoccus coquinae]